MALVVPVDRRDLHRWPLFAAGVADSPNLIAQVVLVPVGDTTVPPLSEARVTRLPAAPDQAAALRAGLRAVDAPYLLLHRPCDELDPGALRRLVESLRRTRSAVASGPWAQLGLDDPWLAAGQAGIPGGLSATTLAQTPALIGDLMIGNKLWRTDAAPAGFDDTDDWLMSPSVARAMTGAALDRIAAPVTTYAFDHGWRAFGATPSLLPGLPAFVRRVAAVAAVLPESLRAPWSDHLAAAELPRYLMDAERATGDEWASLVLLAQGLAPRSAGSDTARALCAAAARGDRDEVAALVTGISLDRPAPPTVSSSTPPSSPASVPVPRSATELTALTLDGTGLVVEGAHLDDLRLVEHPDSVVSRWDGRTIPLLRKDFGVARPLETGAYRLVTGAGNVRCAEALRSLLPLVLTSALHRVTVRLGPAGGVVLDVAAPLDEAAVGEPAQRVLEASYARTTVPVEPGLAYFEAYGGRGVTDSPAAISAELVARRPDLDIVWGLRDHSVSAPPGTRGVLMHSSEWWSVLARAGLLVVNTDVEAWFARRPGQFLVQTYHGHPAKVMGKTLWAQKSLRSGAIAEARRRSAESWSALVTPSAPMTALFREQFDYEGEVIESGFPRTDALVSTSASSRRTAARERLGLGDRTAVLYAPTWREHLATRHRAAASADLLDVSAFADALGDTHVLLLRGHRFHAPTAMAGSVIDVTRYPEIDDLILASDAAVLDYSSLRFDYALTGRPMVFLVPDLEVYETRLRGFLFPFGPSAPGPHVATTDEVVSRLRDVDALGRQWAPAIADFNARFNALADGHCAERVVDRLLDQVLPPAS